MSALLQHQLHTRIALAAQILDLPLTADHIERLAVELTPAMKALLAEQAAAQAESVPVRYAVVSQDTGELTRVQTTTYAGCTTRVSVDVDLESPAALLADQLRARQPDVIATDIPSATYLGLTVRPQSLAAWRWWLDTLGIAAESVTVQDSSAYAVGEKDGVAVELRGDGVPDLLSDEGAARLMGLLAEAGQ